MLPGTAVEADTVLVELSNPQTQQAAMTADLDLRTAKDNYEVLKADLDRDLLAQRALAAGVTADAAQAAMNADADEQMAKQGLISAIQLRRSKLLAETAAARQKMEEQRLANSERTLAVKLSVQQSEVKRRETMAALRRAEATGLKIRSGVAGVLQEVPVQVGQRIGPGTNLARVVDPTRLKAQLQIAETQVKDVVIGQKADIDTRNGFIEGRVVRIDPAARNGTVTVDVALDEALPRGARPDMSVDGTIELERLDNVMYVGRPAFGQEQIEDEPVQALRRSLDGRADAGRARPQLGQYDRSGARPQRRRLRRADRHVAVGRLRPLESVGNTSVWNAVRGS